MNDQPSNRAPERAIVFRPRAVLVLLGVLLGVGALVGFLILAQGALTLIAVAIFLTLALDPAVAFFERRGRSRAVGVASVFIFAIGVVALLALVFIPLLVEQIARFIESIPGVVAAISAGNGPLGFLERDYQVVERVQALSENLTSDLLTGGAAPVLALIGGVAATVVGIIVIIFLTLFMLLEGPEWRARIIDLFPRKNRGRAGRIANAVYGAVGGFITGNLLASLLGGVVATILLLIIGVQYALPVGLLVVLVELIPFIGPLFAIALCTAVAVPRGPVATIIVLAVLIVYHVIEGNTLRPLIYGRALELSPLAVLVSILIGVEVAGILGALVALPVAGSIQAVLREFTSTPTPETDGTGAKPAPV